MYRLWNRGIVAPELAAVPRKNLSLWHAHGQGGRPSTTMPIPRALLGALALAASGSARADDAADLGEW